MLLLALDSAEAACSVALWDAARPAAAALLGHRRLSAARGQADQLIALIDDLLRAAGSTTGRSARSRSTTGPAASPGCARVVAAARGLALAAELPVLAVSSLEALAAAVPERAAGTLRGGARRPARPGLRPGLRSATASRAARARAADPGSRLRPGCRPGRCAWSAAAPRLVRAALPRGPAGR